MATRENVEDSYFVDTVTGQTDVPNSQHFIGIFIHKLLTTNDFSSQLIAVNYSS